MEISFGLGINLVQSGQLCYSTIFSQDTHNGQLRGHALDIGCLLLFRSQSCLVFVITLFYEIFC